MQNRRSFITSTVVGAGTLLATQGARRAVAQADRRMIVDAQIHLWKAESADWKWVPGLKPQLPEPFTIERAIAMMDEAGVDRAVVVPPSWPGDRNDYALEAVKRYPTRFRVMGRIPAAGSEIGGSFATMERAAGHAGRARDLHQPAGRALAHGWHGRLVLAGS